MPYIPISQRKTKVATTTPVMGRYLPLQQRVQLNPIDPMALDFKGPFDIPRAALPGETEVVFETVDITSEDLKEIEKTNEYLRDKPKNLPTLTWLDKIQEIKDNPAQLIPFVSSGKEIFTMGRLALSAKKLYDGEELNETEIIELNDYIEYANRKKSLGYNVTNIVSQIIPFAGEIWATGGIYAIGQKATMKAGLKALQKLTTKTGKELLEKQIVKLGLKTAGVITGSAIRTIPAGATRIPATAIENQLRAYLEGDEETIWKSAVKALGSNYIEYASEMTGGIFGDLTNIGKGFLIKKGLLSAFLKANPGKKSSDVWKIINNLGYHGVINEMLEERVADVGHGLLYEIGLGDQKFSFPSKEQLLTELIAFSIPGVAVSIAEKTTTTISSIKKELIEKGYSEQEATTIARQRGALGPIKPTKPIPKELEPFKGFEDITTKILERLKGKTFVSPQFISDLTKMEGLKQTERDLITEVLKEYPKGQKIPVKEFADKVETQLLPLEETNKPDMTSLDGEYANIVLPDEQRGNVAGYGEHIYENPIKTSAGGIHFSAEEYPNYFAHTRIEDLAGKQVREFKGDTELFKVKGGFSEPFERIGNTRRIIELQSDLFQKGGLEREGIKKGEILPKPHVLSKLQPYRNTWHERIIREEIKRAAQDGKTKLQFPTGETAMKIEGLGRVEMWKLLTSEGKYIEGEGGWLKPENLKEGNRILRGLNDEWIITDVLGDGKFKAVTKKNFDYVNKEWGVKTAKGKDELRMISETFDISGKIDTSNPIYKFYEKEIGKYLKNKYGAKRIVDPQGVSWWEVSIKKEYAKAPVEAFKKEEGGIKFNLTEKEAYEKFRELFSREEVDFILRDKIFTVNPLTGELEKAVGKFSTYQFSDGYMSLVEVVKKKGKISDKVLYHEAFHTYVRMFIDAKVRKEILDLTIKRHPKEFNKLEEEFKKEYGLKKLTNEQRRYVAEEVLADDFGTYMSGVKTFPEKILMLFRKISFKIQKWIGNENKIQKLYDDIVAKKRPTTEITQTRGRMLKKEPIQKKIERVLGIKREVKKITKTEKTLLKERIKNIQQKARIENWSKVKLQRVINKMTARLEEVKRKGELKTLKTGIVERLKGEARGLKKGTVKTKREIKSVQDRVVDLIDESKLELKDKAKFRRLIKNTQTVEQLKRALPEIELRISSLEESSLKRTIQERIDQELKYTKPIKKGQRRVGRYDYQSNKIFEKLREYNKLTQEKAMNEMNNIPKENLSEIDKIKARFLSYKINGSKSSVILQEQVLADINELKRIGAEAKDEADFNKKIEKQEKVEEVLTAITSQKKNWAILKGAKSVYISSVANLYSTLNTIAGKSIADKYDYGFLQTNSQYAFDAKVEQAKNKAKEIYNVKSDGQLNKLFFNDLIPEEFEITGEDGFTEKISRIDLMNVYNGIKNDLIRERYYNYFGEEQINSLLNNLSPEDIKLADYLMKEVQQYRDILNKRNIELFGRDLGTVKNYWPSKSEFQQEFFDDIKMQGEIPSAMRERSKSSKVIPQMANAWLVFQRHVAQAEHIKNLSKKYEELKNLFSDRKIKKTIQEKYGEDVYNALMSHIETFSLNKRTELMDAFSGMYNFALNNWVKAKVGSPTVFARQLISSIYSVEEVGIKNFAKYQGEFIRYPRSSFKFMWDNVPFIKMRFKKGYSEALQDVLRGTNNLNLKTGSVAKYTTIATRGGDITAIVLNGYPIIKTELAKGKTMQEAIETFQKFTEKTQQSPSPANLSQIQRSRNALARTFFRFKNTLNQLLRLQVDTNIQFINKQITAKEFATKTFLYSIYTPMMYVVVGYIITQGIKGLFGKEDEEKKKSFWGDLLQQIIIQPFQTLPLLDAMTETAYSEARKRITGKKYYLGEGLFSYPLLDDVSTAFSKATKKEPTMEDYLRAMSLIQEPMTGIPTETILRYIRYTGKGRSSKKNTPAIPLKTEKGRLPPPP